MILIIKIFVIYTIFTFIGSLILHIKFNIDWLSDGIFVFFWRVYIGGYVLIHTLVRDIIFILKFRHKVKKILIKYFFTIYEYAQTKKESLELQDLYYDIVHTTNHLSGRSRIIPLVIKYNRIKITINDGIIIT